MNKTESLDFLRNQIDELIGIPGKIIFDGVRAKVYFWQL